jgi:hypothetical protein
MNKVKGGKQFEQSIVLETINWCFEEGVLTSMPDISVEICKYKTYKCYGTCVERNDDMTSFNITVANDQTIRDFVATLIHELIHVNQYITGIWKGDGEKECDDRQYPLTDKIWKEGVF